MCSGVYLEKCSHISDSRQQRQDSARADSRYANIESKEQKAESGVRSVALLEESLP